MMGSQADFSAGLLTSDHAVAGLQTPNQSDPMVRFGVYRNNRIVSWRQALRDQFPVCCQLVGDEFFTGLSDLYMAAHPPSSPLMFEFGAQMADFISHFPPAQTVPWLADMARLEYQRVQISHAADPHGLSPEEWAAWLRQPEELAECRLIFQPSLWLYTSDYALYDIWAAHQQEEPDWAAITPHHPQGVMVWRDGWRLRTEAMPIDHVTAILRLRTMTLGAAMTENHDWQAVFAMLIQNSIIEEVRDDKPVY